MFDDFGKDVGVRENRHLGLKTFLLSAQQTAKEGPLAKIYKKTVTYTTYFEGIDLANSGRYAHLGSKPATELRVKRVAACDVLALPIVFYSTGGAFALPEGSIFTKHFDVE